MNLVFLAIEPEVEASMASKLYASIRTNALDFRLQAVYGVTGSDV